MNAARDEPQRADRAGRSRRAGRAAATSSCRNASGRELSKIISTLRRAGRHASPRRTLRRCAGRRRAPACARPRPASAGAGSTLTLCEPQPGHEVRRPLRADHRQFQRALELLRLLARAERVGAGQHQRNRERNHDERDQHHAPVAERVEQLLAQDDPQRPHANRPSSEPMALTNASSRLAQPVAAAQLVRACRRRRRGRAR